MIVRDRGGEVEVAVVSTGAEEQSLQRLPGGWFFGVPTLEGEVEVRCRDGSVDGRGYVTGGIHTWVEVGRPGDGPCRIRGL